MLGDIYTPVAFGETANDGLSMYIGNDVILSGARIQAPF